MRLLWLMIFVGFSSTVFAKTSFPDGRFQGTGKKTFQSGTIVPYNVTMEIKDNSLHFIYDIGGRHFEWDLKALFDKNGFFSMGKDRDGYCGETWCHYTVKFSPEDIEEWTLRFEGDKLYKLGSLRQGESRVFWDEVLTRQ